MLKYVVLAFIALALSFEDAFAAEVPLVVIAPAPAVTSATTSTSDLMSFKDWKSNMIDHSQDKIGEMKSDIDLRKQSARTKTEASTSFVQKVEEELRKEEALLAFAKDLTVTDYFVGYLVKQKDAQTAYKEVANKLTPDEVAELLQAYANHINSAMGRVSTPKTALGNPGL